MRTLPLSIRRRRILKRQIILSYTKNSKPPKSNVILSQNHSEIPATGIQASELQYATKAVIAFTNGNKEIDFEIADFTIDSFENNELEVIKMN